MTFNMSGSSFFGKGNQSKEKASPLDMDVKGIAGKLGSMGLDKDSSSPATYSPAKAKELTDEEKKKARYVKLSKKYEGEEGFKEARNKAFGGTTTVKDGKSTTEKPA